MGTVIAKHTTSGAPKMLNVNDAGELLVKANLEVAVDNIDIGAVNLMNAADTLINPATSDLQTAGNAILTTMDTDTGNIAGGVGTVADTKADVDGNGTTTSHLRRIGFETDRAADNVGGAEEAVADAGGIGSVSAKLRRISTDIGTIDADTGSIKTNTDTLVTAGGGGYVRQDSTATIAKESGGNLATIKTDVDTLVTAGGGGYVRQDSTATIAKESGGNLATIKTDVDTLVTAGGGGYVRQDSTATIAKESGGNLATVAGAIKTEDVAHSSGDVGIMPLAVRTDTRASLSTTTADYTPLQTTANGDLRVRDDDILTIMNAVDLGAGAVASGTQRITFASDAPGLTNIASIKTNTDTLVTAGGGGYVRQDSTATIAKESGGNLATIKTDVDTLVTAGGGGYVRQDSTATIAKESGGNLATLVTDTGLIKKSLGTGVAPVIDSYTSDDFTAAANTADQALVAAPGANKQIWVYGMLCKAGTAAGSIAIQDEDNVVLSGVMSFADKDGFVIPISGNFAMPWFKVATNKALEMDTVTASAAGVITYAIVSV